MCPIPDVSRFDTAVFDVDGTLIDSNGAHAQAYVDALRHHGLDVDPVHVRSVIGMGGDKVIPELAGVDEKSSLGQSITARKKDVFATLLPNLQPTRGARKLLEFLRAMNKKLVIATSASDDELHAILERAGVADLIPQRTSKDDAANSKPDPDIVHAALTRAGAAPAMTVMVGDTPFDIEAATRAGIAIVALRCGGFWPNDAFAGAAGIFDDPKALLEHWRANEKQ